MLRRSRLALIAPVLLLGLAGVSACTPEASGPTSHVVSGTVRGADGRFVDVMLGFDVVDANGQKIDVDGNLDLTGYSAVQRVNWCVPAAGVANPARGCGGRPATDRWSITVPPEAALVYVEAYPKEASPHPVIGPPGYRGYVGPYPGTDNQGHYGMSYRREIPVTGPGAAGVPVLLPVTCEQTGALVGRVTGLPRGTTGTVDAWSLESNGVPILGMGIGKIYANGTYAIYHLAGLSHYGLLASAGGRTLDLVTPDLAAGSDTLIDRACRTKRFDLHF